ncbi:SPFH domain-containing protein [Catenulispora yoronensis]
MSRFGEEGTDRFGASHAQDRVVVQRFVRDVIGSTVEGYLRSAAARYTYREFVENYDDVRLVLQDQLEQALHEWDVQAVRTTLSKFRVDQTGVDEAVRRTAMAHQDAVLKRAELDVAMGQSEIDRVQIGTDRERLKAGQAGLEERIRLLGHDYVAIAHITELLAKAPVPGVVVGGDISEMLRQMPAYRAHELLDYAFGARSVPASTSARQVMPSEVHDSLPAQGTPRLPTAPFDVSVYLGTDDEQQVSSVVTALNDLLAAEGIGLDLTFGPRRSSWFAQYRFRMARGLPNHEAAARIRAVETAIDVAIRSVPPALVEPGAAKHADAAAKLVRALEGIESAVIAIGQLVLVKTTSLVTGASIHAATLTVSQLRAFDMNQELMADPQAALERLQRLGQPDDEPEAEDDE